MKPTREQIKSQPDAYTDIGSYTHLHSSTPCDNTTIEPINIRHLPLRDHIVEVHSSTHTGGNCIVKGLLDLIFRIVRISLFLPAHQKRIRTLVLNDEDGQLFMEILQRLGDIVVVVTRLHEEDPATVAFARVHDEARDELVLGEGSGGDDVEAGVGVLGPKAAAGHDWRKVRAGCQVEGGR
jgi:hypothetical protein